MRAACKNTVTCKDDTTISADDACTNDMSNIPSTSYLARPFKKRRDRIRKKKHSDNKRSIDEESSNISCLTNFMEVDTDLKQQTNEKADNLDLSEYETQEDIEDDWTQIVSKAKGNFNSSLINILSNGVTSINLPQTFEQKQETRLKETIVKSTNSKYNAHVQIEQASSVPSSVTKNNSKATNDEVEDISINNMSNPVQNPTHKRSRIEDGNPVNRDNTKACGSPKLKNMRPRYTSPSLKPKFYCIRNSVIVIMPSGTRFCFTGKIGVKVLYGTVKIYGFTLNKQSKIAQVYSPRGYSNVAIETGEEFLEDSIDDVWRMLAGINITRDSESELQVDVDNVRPGMAILFLHNFENNLTVFLKTFFPTYFKLFPIIKYQHYFPWTDPRRAEVILQANLHLRQRDDSNYRRLIVDPCITTDITERMLNRWSANEWSCTMIVGGKSVGKSTSVRCLINSLLCKTGRVVLVDLDPGQAECTPPNCISYTIIDHTKPLLGPNFTNQQRSTCQLFLDDVDVSRCVTYYLKSVKKLIEDLKKCPNLSRLPIVVNTMGFTKKLGWKIAIFAIKLIRPSIILQIMSSRNKINYDDMLSAAVVNEQESWTLCENFLDEKFDWNKPCEHDLCMMYSQAEIVAARKSEWNMEPYHQRELALMSYLSDIVGFKNDSLRSRNMLELSVAINEVVPYKVPFSSLYIMPRQFRVPASRVLSVINGNIVALCGVTLENKDKETQESKGTSGFRVLTQKSPCKCFGFGIIRGVDMEQQEIFINTPLPSVEMQSVNCLAGCIPVPVSLLQLHQGAPYVDRNAELPTSRKPRRGYFRMRYKNEPNKSE